MMRLKCVSLLCIAVSCMAMAGQSAWAGGHDAKVFKDVTLYFGVETKTPDPNHPNTVDLYHTDFEVSYQTTGWAPFIHFNAAGSGTEGLWIKPQDALLYANANSRWVLSPIPAGFEFIGAKPGQPFWILPQSATSGVLPLGFAAEHADTGRLRSWNPHNSTGAPTSDLWFEVRLLNMRGPADANFALWQADGIHPPVVFMSTKNWGPTGSQNVFYISAGGHVHLNWGFTKPGLYALDFRVSTVLHCDDGLLADWAPPGDGASYYGDGRIDLQDLTWLVAHWGQIPSPNDPNTFMFVDPSQPTAPIGANEMNVLANQWLQCGYCGCDPVDANSFNPNDLIKLLNH